jgi:hypothetical protein
LLSVLTVAACTVTTHHHRSTFPITEVWASQQHFDVCSTYWKQPLVCSLLMLVALAATLLPCCFLLATSICCPFAL